MFIYFIYLLIASNTFSGKFLPNCLFLYFKATWIDINGIEESFPIIYWQYKTLQ